MHVSPVTKTKTVKIIFKIVVSLTLLIWVIQKVNWSDAWRVLHSVDSALFAFYIIFLIGGVIISSYKWMLLGHQKQFLFSFWKYCGFYLAGMFVNNFLPSFVGGDVYRAYCLSRQDGRRGAAISTVVFDRLTGLWSTLLLTSVFALAYLSQTLRSETHFFFGTFFFLLLGVNMCFLIPRVRLFFCSLLRFFPKVVRDPFSRLFDEVGAFTASGGLSRKVIALSVLFTFVGVGLANLLLFRAFGSDMAAGSFLAAIFLVSIISSIPLSINNIGVKEWAYIVFFVPLGVSPEVAVTVALVSRASQTILSLFAVGQYIKDKRSSHQNKVEVTS